MKWAIIYYATLQNKAVAYAKIRRKLMGCFIQWHMVVICIWCVLFVTSQSDVIFMFPNLNFGEVC